MTGSDWPEFGPQRQLIPELPKSDAQQPLDLQKQPTSPVEAGTVPYPIAESLVEPVGSNLPNSTVADSPPTMSRPVQPWPKVVQPPGKPSSAFSTPTAIKPVLHRPTSRSHLYGWIATILIIFSFILGYAIANSRKPPALTSPAAGCADAMAAARELNDAWIQYHALAQNAIDAEKKGGDSDYWANEIVAIDPRIVADETAFNNSSADCDAGR